MRARLFKAARPVRKVEAPARTAGDRVGRAAAATNRSGGAFTHDDRGIVQRRVQVASEALSRVPLDDARVRRTALPGRLKSGVEALSRLQMDDVRVHRNSPEPAKLGALAYAQGSDIHLAPGQERNLPHEAWHVVQQKQGRVKPTLQIKGVGLNDDRALEEEADREGARANSGTSVPHPPSPIVAQESPVVQRRGCDVIQAKLIRHGQEVKIEWYQWGSEVAKRYIAAPQTFVLRDDSKVTSNTIHVLPADQKYLLGEIHGDGTWAKRTKNWSSIDTMHEARKAIPEGVAPGRGRGQSLESLHAYAM